MAAYGGLFASLGAEMAGLAAALPAVRVPLGFVAGADSPLPADEASAGHRRRRPRRLGLGRPRGRSPALVRATGLASGPASTAWWPSPARTVEPSGEATTDH